MLEMHAKVHAKIHVLHVSMSVRRRRRARLRARQPELLRHFGEASTAQESGIIRMSVSLVSEYSHLLVPCCVGTC